MPARSRPVAPRPRSHAEPAPGGPSARERIVHAATAEFARHGYDGARMDAMAKAAGVNKALLYYYFPGKAELYRGLVLEHLGAVAASLEEAAAASADPALALAGVVRTLFDLLRDRPEIAGFILREVLNGWGHLKDGDFPILFRTTRPIASLVERGVESGGFRPVRPLFVHLIIIASLNFFTVSRVARARGARATRLPDIDPDPDEFARFVGELVTRGLAARPDAAPEPTHPGEPA